jgi:hypothetical protein
LLQYISLIIAAYSFAFFFYTVAVNTQPRVVGVTVKEGSAKPCAFALSFPPISLKSLSARCS